MKYRVECKQFSKQDGRKIGERASRLENLFGVLLFFLKKYFVSSTSNEKEARKGYNVERGITMYLFVSTDANICFAHVYKTDWRSALKCLQNEFFVN